MAQSISHHGNPHHNPTQNLGPPNHNHSMQHSSSLHGNLSHNSTHSVQSTTTHPHHQKLNHDHDEDAIARKKKNADAQAAFRQRRQTYIKSLEDTVAELKSAVTEMEVIVKATSQEAKLQRQQAEYYGTRLAAYEAGDLKPGTLDSSQHCKCCKFAVQDFTPRLPTPTNSSHHPTKSSFPTPSTSALTINPAAECPTPSGPSSVTPTLPSQEVVPRDWQSRQGVAPVFHTHPNSRSAPHHHTNHDSCNDPPTSTKSLDYPRNLLHQSRSNSSLQNPSYPRSSCDLSLFPSFASSEPTPMPNFYPSADGIHGSSAQPSGHGSSPSAVANSLELGSNPGHLQSVMVHSYDRTPPLRDPNSLGSNYSPLGSQPFDGHSSDTGPSGYRLHHGINERSVMRSGDYLPSLEVRPLPQSFSVISTVASPTTDCPFGVSGSKNRSPAFLNNKRRRDWGDDKFSPNHDTHETDDSSQSLKPGGSGKLNGIPAKVARCEQALLDVSKVVYHAKEEAKAVTIIPSSTSSTTHHSVSPISTTFNSFTELHNPPPSSSKFQRMKLSGSSAPIITATPITPSSTQDKHQTEQGSHRYQSLMGN